MLAHDTLLAGKGIKMQTKAEEMTRARDGERQSSRLCVTIELY